MTFLLYKPTKWDGPSDSDADTELSSQSRLGTVMIDPPCPRDVDATLLYRRMFTVLPLGGVSI